MGYFSELDIEIKELARARFKQKYGRELSDTIEAHRPPTPAEINRGYGAVHYKTMQSDLFLKPNGTLKNWTKCPYDGLRYSRT